MSSRAKRGICFFLTLQTAPWLVILFTASSLTAAPKEPARPRILGIARVQLLVTDVPEARSFYTKLLGQARDCIWCEQVPSRSFFVNSSQVISLSAAPSPRPSNLIEEITFATDDVPRLRRYLVAHNVAVSAAHKPKDDYLNVTDPEGHRIGFLQESATALTPPTTNPAASLSGIFLSKLRILHAGFVVRDRTAEDHFYTDLLGFHLYWSGGFKDDGLDWYEIQVPDGTDWIEYMLNIPAGADHKELGIQNHFSLGVRDIHATAEQLRKNGIHGFDGPEIGRDGKWSLDAYDPDGTRVEFMEFTPVQPPCCHPYTAAHPKP